MLILLNQLILILRFSNFLNILSPKVSRSRTLVKAGEENIE